MASIRLYLNMFLLATGAMSARADIIIPCKSTDAACINKSAQSALPQIFAGIPSLKIESIDPLHVDLIDGNLSTLKYKFTNTTVKGFKNSVIENVKLDLSKMHLSYDLICHNLEMMGTYDISGRLIVLAIEGTGTYHIDAKKYYMNIESDIDKVKGKDGKEHLHMKNYKMKLEARDAVVFKFDNLFSGNKDLSEAVHKFANENYKEVADFVQEPVFNTNIKKMVGIVNKYLKTIPFDDLFVQ